MAGSSTASAVANQHIPNLSQQFPALQAYSSAQSPRQVAPQLGYLPSIQQPSYNQQQPSYLP
jgi:hypothetical protein